MHPLLDNHENKKVLMLGNEAIARGALEAGAAFAPAYPGTPSSEIALQFFRISRETDLYFEYSVNEKVAPGPRDAAYLFDEFRKMVTDQRHKGGNRERIR
jgi:TPP-dependent indolepyruvate ferredoxin oxidoreductase alpha subunit